MAFREAEGPERPEVVWRRRIPDGPYGEHGPPEARAAARPGRRPRGHGRGASGGGGGAGSRSSWHPVLRTLAGAARPNDPTWSPSAAAERASRLRGIGSGHDRTRPSGRFGSAVGPALAACSRGPARRPPPLSPI